VNDIVYISAADTVDKADASAAATSPAVGFVIQLLGGGQCVVITGGEVAGFLGLVAGSTYFLATSVGAISTSAPTGANQIFQKIGVAKNATTLVAMIEREIVVLK
jgi:hypothetical protein